MVPVIWYKMEKLSFNMNYLSLYNPINRLMLESIYHVYQDENSRKSIHTR